MKLYKGEYSVSEAGRAVKLTIPHDIVKTWGLNPKDKVHLYFEDGVLLVSKSKIIENNRMTKTRDAVTEGIEEAEIAQRELEHYEQMTDQVSIIQDQINEIKVKLITENKSLGMNITLEELKTYNQKVNELLSNYKSLNIAKKEEFLYGAEGILSGIDALYNLIKMLTKSLV